MQPYLTDIGVYRMQVEPYQMGWTLFDLADITSYHLETSASREHADTRRSSWADRPFWQSGQLLPADRRRRRDAQRTGLERRPAGNTAVGCSRAIAVNPAGQANRLAVEDDGSRMRFYVNQALVSEIVEPQLPPGRPGIATVAAGPDGCHGRLRLDRNLPA